MNKKTQLKDLLNLKSKEIISIVGSGGKTSLMYLLAKECCLNKKILITTSTKIYKPEKGKIDYEFYTSFNEKITFNEGVTLIGDYINEDGKVICGNDTIQKYMKKFDFTIIESDGSKRKPLKGWGYKEPVVLKETTKTIGVIPLNVLGLKVCNKTVHRIEEFKNITNSNEDDEIILEFLVKIITNKNGLFKNSVGEKILFINCIEKDNEINMARKLLHKIQINDDKLLSKVIGGSLRKEIFFELK